MLKVVAGTGTGFLLAVLWFDLIFDVQVRRHREADLPVEVRDSIAAYYRRVTTDAHPMNRLVAAAMLMTLAALVGELVAHDVHPWAAWSSLVLIAAAVGLARRARSATRCDSGRRPTPRHNRARWRERFFAITSLAAPRSRWR